MRLFRITLATIFQRNSWAVCLFAVLAMPFVLPWISSATEKPLLVQPARVQAAWVTLWICALCWGLFTAAQEGESNAKSGIGEYFQTTGMSAGKQLVQIWLAVLCFVAPLALTAAGICMVFASPADPNERWMWLALNAQYVVLFLLVLGPLLALSIAVASRFGGIAGFALSLLLALYGLYGVGYLDNMLKVEDYPLLRGLWAFSPQYRFADLTQRLYFKSGALTTSDFWLLVTYFSGIFACYLGLSRWCFRTRLS